MRGRRLEQTGSIFAGIRGGLFRAENDADCCRSCAAVEWHYSDRLLTERKKVNVFRRPHVGLEIGSHLPEGVAIALGID
ncbi:MAG: hypothetical protein K0S58_3188 [Nitrospira sp.]|nr:hypothetical protein [Nitrospira sp.]